MLLILKKLKLDKASLGLEDDCSDYIYIKAVEENLHMEFIHYINSNNWTSLDSQESLIPNISLHARMRIIDRFAMPNYDNAEDLYSGKNIAKLRSFVKSIYQDPNIVIKGNNTSNRIITNTNYGQDVIETVFAKNGEMITTVVKS